MFAKVQTSELYNAVKRLLSFAKNNYVGIAIGNDQVSLRAFASDVSVEYTLSGKTYGTAEVVVLARDMSPLIATKSFGSPTTEITMQDKNSLRFEAHTSVLTVPTEEEREVYGYTPFPELPERDQQSTIFTDCIRDGFAAAMKTADVGSHRSFLQHVFVDLLAKGMRFKSTSSISATLYTAEIAPFGASGARGNFAFFPHDATLIKALPSSEEAHVFANPESKRKLHIYGGGFAITVVGEKITDSMCWPTRDVNNLANKNLPVRVTLNVVNLLKKVELIKTLSDVEDGRVGFVYITADEMHLNQVWLHLPNVRILVESGVQANAPGRGVYVAHVNIHHLVDYLKSTPNLLFSFSMPACNLSEGYIYNHQHLIVRFESQGYTYMSAQYNMEKDGATNKQIQQTYC